MTETQQPHHTPGPWRPSMGYEGEENRWCVTVASEPHYIVIAMIHNGAPGGTLDTEAANAHLVAAAPTLLAALELAHEALSDDRWYGQSTTAITIRAAIALAKGE